MSGYRVYISYVIQKPDGHVHDSALVEFPLPKYSFYMDDSALKVLGWAEARQAELPQGEKIVVLHFFNVPPVK